MYIKSEIWINELEEAGSDEPGVTFEADVYYEPETKDWYDEQGFQTIPEYHEVNGIRWDRRTRTDEENRIISKHMEMVREEIFKAYLEQTMSFNP